LSLYITDFWLFFVQILIFRGAPAGAGGAAARGGRFFEKKLRKKLFLGKSFYWSMLMARTWGHSFLWDGRAQYLPRAKTVLCGAFPHGAHFSLGEIKLWMLGGL